jgi:PAS domain S-box-containing protein
MAVAWGVMLILAGSILISLGAYARRRRATAGASSFSLLLFAIALWSLGYALELLSQSLAAKMFWIKVEYPGIVATPVLWLVFALQYTGRGRWLSRRNLAFLSLLPLTTVLLVWTNETHHLVYRFNVIEWSSGWPLLYIEYGPWFWVNALFAYGCMLLGTLALGGTFLRSSLLYRQQTGVLLAGAMVPWLGNALYLVRLWPSPNLDPTPLAFAISGLVVAFGLFRYRLLQVVPVARRVAVEAMPQALIVLDGQNCIADLNPAARRLFNLTDKQAIGRPVRQVLGPVELVERYADVRQVNTEIERGSGEERRVYRMTISPLDDRTLGGMPARLVLISDITAQVRAREALERTNRRLLALQESTAALTALLSLDQVLDLILEQLARVVDYQGATVALFHDDRLECVVARGFAESASIPAFSLGVSDNAIFQETLSSRAPVIIADVGQDPRWTWVEGVEFTRAWIGAPLMIQDRIIGQLSIYHSRPGCYGPEDGQILLAFARKAAVAIDNAQLHEETRRWADRLRVLYEVSTAAATATGLEEALQRTVHEVQRTMGADNVALLLLEPETGELVIRAWAGFPGGPTLMRRQVGIGIPGWVVETGQPALIPDVSQDARYHACDGDARSELCVPLLMGQQVLGALNLESRQADAFADGDLHLLTTLAGHLAAIIENARLGEEARARAEILSQQNRHLTLLHEIARVASSTLEPADLYQALADTLAQIIGGDGCYITRIDETTGKVLGAGAYGPYRDTYRGVRPPPGELTLTESVLRTGQPLAVDDVFHSPYLSPRIAEMFPARSQLGLPLRLGERGLGAVLIAFNDRHTFTEEEIAWATRAVDLAALAIENTRLYEEVKIWAAELEERVESRTRELQEAQAQLLHAEKLAALGRLSAGISHEIGHPLGLIHGYVELLNEELSGHPYLRPVRDAIERLMVLLDQLRNFSRPAGEDRSLVAVNQIVTRVLALADNELTHSRIEVQQNLDADLPLTEADAGQLEQVFLNLVLNARDAMPKGGELRVRTYSRANQIVAEFGDTGMGIPADNLERIFEPYFTTKSYKGTGLGLAICRQIVAAHGGRIEAESEVGAGTTFRVYLPAGNVTV